MSECIRAKALLIGWRAKEWGRGLCEWSGFGRESRLQGEAILSRPWCVMGATGLDGRHLRHLWRLVESRVVVCRAMVEYLKYGGGCVERQRRQAFTTTTGSRFTLQPELRMHTGVASNDVCSPSKRGRPFRRIYPCTLALQVPTLEHSEFCTVFHHAASRPVPA